MFMAVLLYSKDRTTNRRINQLSQKYQFIYLLRYRGHIQCKDSLKVLLKIPMRQETNIVDFEMFQQQIFFWRAQNSFVSMGLSIPGLIRYVCERGIKPRRPAGIGPGHERLLAGEVSGRPSKLSPRLSNYR